MFPEEKDSPAWEGGIREEAREPRCQCVSEKGLRTVSITPHRPRAIHGGNRGDIPQKGQGVNDRGKLSPIFWGRPGTLCSQFPKTTEMASTCYLRKWI